MSMNRSFDVFALHASPGNHQHSVGPRKESRQLENQRNTFALANFVRIAHRGQVDKNRCDYFETHLLPVARSVPSNLFFAALAHDILEDTKTNAADLSDAGFTPFEIQLIELLTKTEANGHYYLQQIAVNPDAKIIKVMDIVNNLSRMNTLKDRGTAERLTVKYLNALSHLRF